MSEYSDSSNFCLLNPVTLQVCSHSIGELGSENNSLLIDDSEPLGSPSNPILINCKDSECSPYGLPVWSDSAIDCPIKIETHGGILREEHVWFDVDKFQTVKQEANIGLIEEIDLTDSNLPASDPKDTEVLAPIPKDVHGLGTSPPALNLDKFEDQADAGSSIPKIDEKCVLIEPENEDQADAGPSIPKSGDVDLVSTKLTDRALKRGVDFRRSERIAKRVKV
ncbi:hypothetical protein N7540_012524 [Penicillium herquei]|nr:hypothetical protein N7540_012524 [Penicillium herquei]